MAHAEELDQDKAAQAAAEKERDALHPRRRATLDRIMARHPALTLAEALEAFKEAGG